MTLGGAAARTARGARPGDLPDDDFLPEPPAIDPPEASTFARELRQTFFDIERRLFPDQAGPSSIAATPPEVLDDIDLDSLGMRKSYPPYDEEADTFTPYVFDDDPSFVPPGHAPLDSGPPADVVSIDDAGPRARTAPAAAAPPSAILPARAPGTPSATLPGRAPGTPSATPPDRAPGTPGGAGAGSSRADGALGRDELTDPSMALRPGSPPSAVPSQRSLTPLGVTAVNFESHLTTPAPHARSAAAARTPAQAPAAARDAGDVDEPLLGPSLAPSGSLQVDAVPVLLDRAWRSRASGRLVLVRGQAEKAIWLDRGMPIFATSNLPYDRMGDLLYREGKITRRQWEQSCELVAQSGRRMGAVLVDQGFLKPRELFPAVRRHVEEIIYSLFEWSDGQWRYDAGGGEAEERIRLSAHPGALVMEGIRRKARRDRILRALGAPSSLEVRLAPGPGDGYSLSQVGLFPEERELFDHIDGEKSLAEVVSRCPLDELAALQAIYGLHVLGFIRVVSPPPVRPSEGQGRGEETATTPYATAGSRREESIDYERTLERYARVRDGDYFAILGVRRDATDYEVRRAYQSAKEAIALPGMSPSVAVKLRRELAEIDEVLDEAYAILKDAGLRESYRAHLVD